MFFFSSGVVCLFCFYWAFWPRRDCSCIFCRSPLRVRCYHLQLVCVGQNTCKGRPGCLATLSLAHDIGILHDGAPPPLLKFNEYGGLAELVNNSPHGVEYRDVPYPTAPRLLEARKFLDHKPCGLRRVGHRDQRAVGGLYAVEPGHRAQHGE